MKRLLLCTILLFGAVTLFAEEVEPLSETSNPQTEESLDTEDMVNHLFTVDGTGFINGGGAGVRYSYRIKNSIWFTGGALGFKETSFDAAGGAALLGFSFSQREAKKINPYADLLLGFKGYSTPSTYPSDQEGPKYKTNTSSGFAVYLRVGGGIEYLSSGGFFTRLGLGTRLGISSDNILPGSYGYLDLGLGYAW